MTTVQSELTPLSEVIIDELVRQANEGYPNETCGFIMKLSSGINRNRHYILPCRNVHKSPTHYFEIDHEELAAVYEKEQDIVGMYHSHPNGPDKPSPADKKYAPEGIRYFIVTRTHVFEYDTDTWKAVR
jgi:desampylase